MDDAYAAQMAYRRKLIGDKRPLVLDDGDVEARDAAAETLQEAMKLMPEMGFRITPQHIFCPDGTQVDRTLDTPLAILGRCVQEDICILYKRGDEHVLGAAVLCFPASWTLSEKIGRPLSTIHIPVANYDADVAKRVQRMFDGVHESRPLWRNNMLGYDDPELFTPRSESDPVRPDVPMDRANFIRAELQSILRLPQTRAIVFSIHSYVARNQKLAQLRQA